MNDLKTVSALVKQILEDDVDARNSDMFCIWKFSDTTPRKKVLICVSCLYLTF